MSHDTLYLIFSCMNLIRKLIKEALLLEAKENAEFLIKLNYDALKKRKPDLHPRELQKIAREGPLYTKNIIDAVNKYERPNGYERQFIKWLGDTLPRSMALTVISGHTINYTYDWYLGDEEAKNQINNLSFNEAADKAVEWHESLKDEDFDTDIVDERKTKTVYKFGNGSKIVELSWEDCEAEGDSMGHCVGTIHTKYVKDGEEKIFSLRSETNKPHVTISVDPKTNKVLEIKGRENKIPIEKHAKLIKEWLKTTDLDYTLCNDYFNILSQSEKKEMLQTSKEKSIDSFFNLIFNELIYDANLSKQDFTKIALGAAMSCVHLTQEVKRTTELLSVIRDWTNGKASDEKLNRVYNELYELYRKSNYLSAAATPAARAAATAAAAASAGVAARVAAAGSVARVAAAGIPKQNIISSIEKEVGMSFEELLFKNEEQEVNESLIKNFIALL